MRDVSVNQSQTLVLRWRSVEDQSSFTRMAPSFHQCWTSVDIHRLVEVSTGSNWSALPPSPQEPDSPAMCVGSVISLWTRAALLLYAWLAYCMT